MEEKVKQIIQTTNFMMTKIFTTSIGATKPSQKNNPQLLNCESRERGNFGNTRSETRPNQGLKCSKITRSKTEGDEYTNRIITVLV